MLGYTCPQSEQAGNPLRVMPSVRIGLRIFSPLCPDAGSIAPRVISLLPAAQSAFPGCPERLPKASAQRSLRRDRSSRGFHQADVGRLFSSESSARQHPRRRWLVRKRSAAPGLRTVFYTIRYYIWLQTLYFGGGRRKAMKPRIFPKSDGRVTGLRTRPGDGGPGPQLLCLSS